MVIWSQPAIADLRSIHDFIAPDSRFYAKKVVHDIREKTSVLGQLPKTGKKVPELDDDHIRELSLYSYRIIYEIAARSVFVLAVVHKRRDLKAEDIRKI
ncbi:type II toxin-antitoxin system RelE/ParE family toxin [Marinobacter sp. S6332]|uniref:type II toxin-antitoxin system RelE/ParE family toxin n=1 Tax=Marinobacter sp. S6332 TaxID=2926403 RepID=UPI001FF2A77B|nr:type II toxin-antitoxin system RelE/ParE family toxin [Marinobacter sp. S6332]MCK0164007.1 type II toxin-antitoxin system RelE/ParE family toxin [Marinobacter sp. S6332]